MSEAEKLMQLLREKLGPMADVLWQQALRSARLEGICLTAVGSALLLTIIVGWIIYSTRDPDNREDFRIAMVSVTVTCGLLGVLLLPYGLWELGNLQLVAFRGLIG